LPRRYAFAAKESTGFCEVAAFCLENMTPNGVFHLAAEGEAVKLGAVRKEKFTCQFGRWT
jgi:hypothetical protein